MENIIQKQINSSSVAPRRNTPSRTDREFKLGLRFVKRDADHTISGAALAALAGITPEVLHVK